MDSARARQARTLPVGSSAENSPIRCSDLGGEGRDLRCIDLVPTADYGGVVGRIDMHHAASPFGVAVSADGTPLYDLEATVSGLPDGAGQHYVVWLTTEFMAPVSRLGTLRNGTIPLGPVALNKFRVLVSLEADTAGVERTGPLVLRGASPSSRLQGHDYAFASPLAAYQNRTSEGDGGHAHTGGDGSWSMPPMRFDMRMPPGMSAIRPDAAPWLPVETEGIELARPQSWIRMNDGDTLTLRAAPIRRRLHSRDVVMFGFNGEFPGPLIEVAEATTATIEFVNDLPIPTAVHWHGLRLDNRFDGVPGVTQEAVEPGGRFVYTVHFPDSGIYWYHPHHREDILQDLGLYGNLLVRPTGADGLPPVSREEVLLLDDILIRGLTKHGMAGGSNEGVNTGGLEPYGATKANYSLMGRFGNMLLVNGEARYDLELRQNDVVRLYLTNVSNTRTFNLRFDGGEMLAVGSDLGMFEWVTPIESIVIAPAERYIVDVRYPRDGTFTVTNAIQALDHVGATYFSVVDTLGFVQVSPVTASGERGAMQSSGSRQFDVRTANVAAQLELRGLRRYMEVVADHSLELTLRVTDLPAVVEQLMRPDRVYFPPVEWEGTMPMMNWASTSDQVEWILRDPESGRENMDIDWRFSVGDTVKIRVVNDRDAFHGMQHPLHIHGQRFVVLSQDGRPNDNLVWKDTVLLPAGSTTDLVLEVSNPGQWMVHCHIAEHLESGMRMVFGVDP